MSTVAAYEQIGELCDTQTDLRRVGEHVAITWLAPTVAMHNENIAVSNLRESLKACATSRRSATHTLDQHALQVPGREASGKPVLRHSCDMKDRYATQ